MKLKLKHIYKYIHINVSLLYITTRITYEMDEPTKVYKFTQHTIYTRCAKHIQKTYTKIIYKVHKD